MNANPLEKIPGDKTNFSVQEIFKQTLEKAAPMEREPKEEFEKRREKQHIIVELLPDDLLEDIKESVEQERIFREIHEEPRLTLEEKKIIVRGAIFESLADIEYKRDEHREPSLISQQLVDIYKNPPKTLREAVGRVRNPDLVDITENPSTHTLLVTGLAEVKLGRLDIRAYDQLEGFHSSLDDVVETLKQMKNYNLEFPEHEELLQNINNLEIAADLNTIILFPADRNLEDYDSYINYDEFERNGQEDLYDAFIKEILPKCDKRKTVFTTKEIVALQKSLDTLLGF